ncbi:hypothetical protein SNE40_023604 [Patella caerulea]|uniref:Uncharacterized protein n=1 Tax=Patella caerulea TaxID=87958 RepID=A0AAN8G3A2_PATCE
MSFRKKAGIAVFVLTVCVYLLQPGCLQNNILGCTVSALVFYTLMLTTSGFLLFKNPPQELVDSKGKAVFITGCDSGFGAELACRLDKLGYTVFAGCLMPDREGAQGLKEMTSGRVHIVHMDVTDDWLVRQAVQYVKNNIGDNILWALVNNAGVAVFTEIEWCSVEQYTRIMDVNVIGVVRVTKAFLPLIRPSKGRVVNVASLAGRFTLPAFSAYSMSKKACIAFSDGLRLEMSKFDVKVITIEPGLYRTPISSEEYLIDMNRKSWAETPKDIKNDYGEEYFDAFLQNITQQMKRARPHVHEVTDLMVQAVVTKNPHFRYVPYWMTYLRSELIRYLPTSVTDKYFKAISVKCDVQSKRRESERDSKENGKKEK